MASLPGAAAPQQQQQQPAAPTYPAQPKLPKKRTRTGCLTCRKRKHKCGEEKPDCARCLRAGMACVWPPPSTSSDPSSSTASSAAAAGPSGSGSKPKSSSTAAAAGRPYPHPADAPRRGGSGSSAGRTPTMQRSTATSSGASSPRLTTASGLPSFPSAYAFQPDLHLPFDPALFQQHPVPLTQPSPPPLDAHSLLLLNQPTYPIFSPFDDAQSAGLDPFAHQHLHHHLHQAGPPSSNALAGPSAHALSHFEPSALDHQLHHHHHHQSYNNNDAASGGGSRESDPGALYGGFTVEQWEAMLASPPATGLAGGPSASGVAGPSSGQPNSNARLGADDRQTAYLQTSIDRLPSSSSMSNAAAAAAQSTGGQGRWLAMNSPDGGAAPAATADDSWLIAPPSAAGLGGEGMDGVEGLSSASSFALDVARNGGPGTINWSSPEWQSTWEVDGTVGGLGNAGEGEGGKATSHPLSPQKQASAVRKAEAEDDDAASDGRRQQASLTRYATPTSSLVLLFPNPEERHLMQHFLYSIPALFVGVPLESPHELTRLATEEHPNLNSFFPFLDIPHFLSLPRGQSSAADALALSLMSVGAGRLSHLYHSAAESSPSGDPTARDNSARYAQLSAGLVQAALGLGQTSLAFARLRSKGLPGLEIGNSSSSISNGNGADGGGGSSAPSEGMDDGEITHLLSACSSCILARCLSGGRGFEAALDLARSVVDFAGGPKKMLDALSSSSAAASVPGSASITSLDISSTPTSPTAFGGGTSLTTPTTTTKATRRKRLRMLRSVLEDLSSWDLFASLSTGLPPSTFSSSSPHSSGASGGLAEWLFAYSPPSGTREGTSGEDDWETLESTLGFSRILMDLFSRVNVLYASSRSPPPNCSEDQVAMLAVQLLHEIRVRKADVLRSYPELAQPSFPPLPGGDAAAEAEYRRRVRYGRLGRDDEHEGLGRGKARRLQFGDLVWTLTLEIMVRVEVQGEPSNAKDIKALALRVVALVQEAHRRSLVTLGFLWPLVIAGSQLSLEADRQAVRLALETLRSYTCFDLQSGQEILREVWTARDGGDQQATFRDVAPRCGAVVL